MSGPDTLAALFLRDVLSRASHLKDEAQTLADYEYRSPTPQRVARIFHDIVEQAEHEIRLDWDSYREASSPADQTTILDNIRLWDSILRSIGGRLRYIIGAAASRVPAGLGLLLETIVQEQQLCDGILLREKWTYNYALDTMPIERAYREKLSAILSPEQLDSIFGSGDVLPSTYAIGFPAIERNNTLLHCAIAHEIGHIAVERWLKSEDGTKPEVTKAARVAATKIIGQASGETDLAEWAEIVDSMNRILTARRRFLQEYGSDVYAVELFGPAALLAMTNIAMSQGLDSEPRADTNFYPSGALGFDLRWIGSVAPRRTRGCTAVNQTASGRKRSLFTSRVWTSFSGLHSAPAIKRCSRPICSPSRRFRSCAPRSRMLFQSTAGNRWTRRMSWPIGSNGSSHQMM